MLAKTLNQGGLASLVCGHLKVAIFSFVVSCASLHLRHEEPINEVDEVNANWS